MAHLVSEIFDEPERWGLRGDPIFWRYLKDYYADYEIPYPVESLKKDILRLFTDFAGKPPAPGKSFYVKDFDLLHSGMSRGMLSGDFWLNEAIPILSKRLEQLNED